MSPRLSGPQTSHAKCYLPSHDKRGYHGTLGLTTNIDKRSWLTLLTVYQKTRGGNARHAVDQLTVPRHQCADKKHRLIADLIAQILFLASAHCLGLSAPRANKASTIICQHTARDLAASRSQLFVQHLSPQAASCSFARAGSSAIVRRTFATLTCLKQLENAPSPRCRMSLSDKETLISSQRTVEPPCRASVPSACRSAPIKAFANRTATRISAPTTCLRCPMPKIVFT